ncbi:hypothetical protein HNQ91_000523 [Filimonas zeae]|uniref:Uncharacterized protein n=1 Tax=Filimonas zeae TaxID=1737353 RepID=A0A917MR08_9BACT|nr:hypothetical protein [Filimonas zeae]MDR6337501.1 hypothetical protein [Filimonas zeae]GGH58918.1 hypothetical protein GCM10011379_05120 [Filimonas zeae]
MQKPNAIGSTSAKEGPFQVYMNYILDNVFTPAQKAEYNHISDTYDAFFKAAKEKKRSDLETLYNECCSLADKMDAGIATWVIAICAPRLSYYQYSRKDFTGALDFTLEIIAANQLLQQQGYQYLFFSEIQQLHNLSRIYFTQNRMEEAVQVSVRCIRDMAAHAGKWGSFLPLKGMREEEVIAESQYGMTIQVLTETFIRLLKMHDKDAGALQYWFKAFTVPVSRIRYPETAFDIRYQQMDAVIHLLLEMMENYGSISDSYLQWAKEESLVKELKEVLLAYLRHCVTAQESIYNINQ